MRAIIFLFVGCIILCSCKKKALATNSFSNCNRNQNLDSAAIYNKMIGSWRWIKQYNIWTDKTTKADKNIQATFNSDRTFSVIENSTIINQGNWKLVVRDGVMWGVDLTPTGSYFYGRILFCANQILFNNSYIDGADNLFEKVK